MEARIGSATRVIGGHEQNRIEEEGTKEEHKIESGECNNDPHTIVWL